MRHAGNIKQFTRAGKARSWKKNHDLSLPSVLWTEEEALAFIEEMKKNIGMPDITAMYIPWDEQGIYQMQ